MPTRPRCPASRLIWATGRGILPTARSLPADATGGLAAGLILESRGLLPPRVRTAFILAMIWCAALIGFARSHTYFAAILLLIVAGFVELSFNAMAQALVQLNAPDAMRGRVIGVFSMFAMGSRTFSGLSVRPAGFPRRHPQFADLQRRRAAVPLCRDLRGSLRAQDAGMRRIPG